jgi:hypothetical protein
MTAPTPTETDRPGAEINSGALSPTPEGEGTGEQENGSGKSPGAEAAKYRVRAREAEQALATAQGRIEAYQLRGLIQVAGKSLSNPADLLALSGKALQDFLGDDGDVDPELVTEAADELLSTRPGLRHAVLATDPTQGHGGASGTPPLTWADLLK